MFRSVKLSWGDILILGSAKKAKKKGGATEIVLTRKRARSAPATLKVDFENTAPLMGPKLAVRFSADINRYVATSMPIINVAVNATAPGVAGSRADRTAVSC
jgi:hypothetical protein